jgi:hypothetical protein
MPKTKKVPEQKVVEMPKPLPSVEEFREAVKYALTHDHGMPSLYAEEVLDGDPEFVERHRQTFSTAENAIANAADGLRFEPPKGLKWVALSQGQRIADKEQLVLDADGALGRYLESLVTLGLHGPDRDAVASSMLAKGIESVFPLIATNMGRYTA